LSSQDDDFWKRSVPFFERKEFSAGQVLYHSGDRPEDFYLLETGILKAYYDLPQGSFSEVIVAGATCGELPFFSATSRTATVVADRDSVAWVLTRSGWASIQRQEAEIAHELLKLSLILTSERMNAITKYVLFFS
jgi:sulfate permease, SulP family